MSNTADNSNRNAKPVTDKQPGQFSTQSISENEREICIGDKCFVVRVPKQGGEVKIDAQESECTPEQLKFMRQLKLTLAQGGATNYSFNVKPEEKK